MYYAALAGAEAPYEYYRWQMAEKFGWTLEYIDNLSIADLQEFIQVEDGIKRADNSILKDK